MSTTTVHVRIQRRPSCSLFAILFGSIGVTSVIIVIAGLLLQQYISSPLPVRGSQGLSFAMVGDLRAPHAPEQWARDIYNSTGQMRPTASSSSPMPQAPSQIHRASLSGQNLTSGDLTRELFYSRFGKSFDSISELDLSYNRITTISHLCDWFPQLKILDLTNNSIQLIDPASLKWATLEKLILTENLISSLPPSMCAGLPRLRQLHLATNQLDNAFNGPLLDCPSLQILNLAANNFTVVTDNMFVNVTSLRAINLDGNRIRTLNREAFLPLKNSLVNLYLSHNSIKELPEINGFVFAALRHLELGYNHITNIQRHTFVNMFRLVFLSLKHNRIVYIADEAAISREREHSPFENLKILLLHENNPTMEIQLNAFGELISLNDLIRDVNVKFPMSTLPDHLRSSPDMITFNWNRTSEFHVEVQNVLLIIDTVNRQKTPKRMSLNIIGSAAEDAGGVTREFMADIGHYLATHCERDVQRWPHDGAVQEVLFPNPSDWRHVELECPDDTTTMSKRCMETYTRTQRIGSILGVALFGETMPIGLPIVDIFFQRLSNATAIITREAALKTKLCKDVRTYFPDTMEKAHASSDFHDSMFPLLRFKDEEESWQTADEYCTDLLDTLLDPMRSRLFRWLRSAIAPDLIDGRDWRTLRDSITGKAIEDAESMVDMIQFNMPHAQHGNAAPSITFLKALRRLTGEQLRGLLRFWTGSPFLTRMPLIVQFVNTETIHSHTCEGRIDLFWGLTEDSMINAMIGVIDEKTDFNAF